ALRRRPFSVRRVGAVRVALPRAHLEGEAVLFWRHGARGVRRVRARRVVAQVEVEAYAAVHRPVHVEEPAAAVGLPDVGEVAEIDEEPAWYAGWRRDQRVPLAVPLERGAARHLRVGDLAESVDDGDRLSRQGRQELGVDDPLRVRLVPGDAGLAITPRGEPGVVDADAEQVTALEQLHRQRRVTGWDLEAGDAVRRPRLGELGAVEHEPAGERRHRDLLSLEREQGGAFRGPGRQR